MLKRSYLKLSLERYLLVALHKGLLNKLQVELVWLENIIVCHVFSIGFFFPFSCACLDRYIYKGTFGSDVRILTIGCFTGLRAFQT